ncbi:MAG: phosphoribosylamine--glycine ligase [Clostridiales bacterium]|nr:phosphoribosylamine--glycine ligase [Clostridiales bacterium]
MKILVVGGGGREHALVWKLGQSPHADKIYCAPGNAGIADLAQCLPIAAEDLPAICRAVDEYEIDLTVVGPEAPLAAGLADVLEKNGKLVFGPSRLAAQLESSKEFAKTLMKEAKIPTAAYQAFSDPDRAEAYIKAQKLPLVIKADGLAAGKGVVVAQTIDEAVAAVYDMLEGGAFGAAGRRVLIEEFLEGQEVSVLAFCDGKQIVPLVSSQDHKRAFDGDLGPNTGGMGAFSPAVGYTQDLARRVEQEILAPTVAMMAHWGRPYKGVLYAGLMLTEEGPKVLEYNVRFGDPETQALLLCLKTDLLEIIQAVLAGRLSEIEIIWRKEAAACVVLAAEGYPGAYAKNRVINGLAEAQALGVEIFHAGTARKKGQILTAGGRVLALAALGEDITQAAAKAYQAAELIHFEGCFYRKDIACKAVRNEELFF